ncbi:MAG: prenyltransferase/squalene oxidase repeat-containing protein [Anaerolineae bacterium]
MEYRKEILRLLDDIGTSEVLNSAYDTAWVARLAPRGEAVGRHALEWLRKNQLADGTWGAELPRYYHDRLVCTLAAAIALVVNDDPQDADRIQRAKFALETVIEDLRGEMTIETVGFELFVPTLFHEAERLGIVQKKDYTEMPMLKAVRERKLSRLPGGVVNRHVTLAFSAEMAGTDEIGLLDVARLQEANGSVGNSPAATAYYLLHVRPDDQAALNYLYRVARPDGGVPFLTPFDIFEPLWVLWNVALLCDMDDELIAACQRHLDHIEKNWTPGKGIGHAEGYMLKDGDDTGVAYDILRRFGRSLDLETVLTFEEREYFRCYALEANPSICTNIHILQALRNAGVPSNDPSVQKIKTFLHSTAFWFDKWHVSPYYATSHAVIAAAGYLDGLVEDAVNWMIDTQNEDGSWGYFMPTAEETAYALQALVVWHRNGHEVPPEILARGAAWLESRVDAPNPPLYIGKCLYLPVLIVRATILSALALVTEILNEKATC